MMKQPELPEMIRDLEIVKSLNRISMPPLDEGVDAESVDAMEDEGPLSLS
ncbi:MAG: hypothetical protein K6T63_06835 [Alicyclobacillus herbarius]|nr:hypothetical protein [Alicyclobacillus herbarius]MCL6632336.1 hypothetical protein [Alicyclobacillus herbarius]